MEKQTSLKPPYEECMHGDFDNSPEIKACINRLLYNPDESKEELEPELLTIVLDRSKAHHLDFLRNWTESYTIGTWEECEDEKNVQFDIQFDDTKDEEIGKRLEELLGKLNENVIGEDLLYFRTTPVEETSLEED